MTKLFSLFIILSFVLPVSGQEKLDSDKARKEKAYHLTGSVREQGERPYPDPLPDVNIQLYSLPDTSFIEGTVSDKKGVFRLYPMNPGNYLIIWGIERSGFFNGREKWAKGFENQRV